MTTPFLQLCHPTDGDGGGPVRRTRSAYLSLLSRAAPAVASSKDSLLSIPVVALRGRALGGLLGGQRDGEDQGLAGSSQPRKVVYARPSPSCSRRGAMSG